MNDLTILFPDKKLTLAAGEVTVRPFKFVDCFKAAAIISKYWVKFGESESDIRALIPEMMLSGGEDVFALMLLSIDRDQAFLTSLSSTDGVYLLKEVIEVNADFFIQKLLPLIQEMAEKYRISAGAPSPQS